MHSNSFETQEMRDISRKEAGKPRGFPILLMATIEEDFLMKGKKCQDEKV